MAESRPHVGDLAKQEEEILKFWNKNRIFEKSVEKDAPRGEYVFYDGPPFATGLPHYGHILAGTIKDAIPRYRTMRGYRVHRRWGWDCHGLPLEAQIEEELGIKTKQEIETLGVDVFNQKAFEAVLRYADDWRRIVPRMGRFVDMKNDYRTMDANYTESVWNIFKTLYDKKLIYKGYKVLHLSPLLGTELSNIEVAQNYQDIADYTVVLKLPLEEEKNTSLLVWTTTAWTLPGNMAAAVHKDKMYVKIKVGNEYFILAKAQLKELFEEHTATEEFLGKELLGKRYRPPFDYYKDRDLKGKKNAWKIYHAPYVSMEEGTGAVHLAPAYGTEDMELAQKEGIPTPHHVNRDGTFKEFVTDFKGLQAKPKGNPQETDAKIIAHLEKRGLLVRKDTIMHSYPHCPRTDAPLLNYAMDSWFVEVTRFKDKLVAENKKVHWVPDEIGKKRFGNWLLGARDWSISRSRYWGASMPVWVNKKRGLNIVIGSVKELKKYTKTSGNHYFVMRHGEAVFNTKGILNANLSVENPLTKGGKQHVIKAAELLAKENVDLIFHSPLQRTKETAQVLSKELKLPPEAVIEDERLREVTFGEFEGKTIGEYHSFFKYSFERMIKKPKRGELWSEVKMRVSELLYEMEHRYRDKTILIVSHNGPIQMIHAGASGFSVDECAKSIADKRFTIGMGEVRELPFIPLPHNKEYELDLHRPYIDEIKLVDRDGTPLKRIPAVFDCWFESGAMPYGQHHYPFENLDRFDPRGGWFKKAKGYPADFIAEGIDQTRGWFYSLLVLGVALFGKSPYKNVIVNGTVLTDDGQKLSKRLKNYPDPMDLVNKYGADSIRYYLLSSPIMRAEDLAFSEKGVEEVMRKLIVRLANVYSFYALYANEKIPLRKPESIHILDRFILARLDELVKEVTDAMEHYELDRATRPIAIFIDDLSTWYLRRSRERFKGVDAKDKESALITTRFVLVELSKIMAPFMPFYAEFLYQKVRSKYGALSVHLDTWPQSAARTSSDRKLLEDMKEVRHLVSLALEKRAEAGIKVRQPLRALAIKHSALEGKLEFLELIKEEVNVKEISFDPIIEDEVMLDTVLTPELKEEGLFRELLRQIQALRKKKNLTPTDQVVLVVYTDESGRIFVKKHKEEILRAARLSSIDFTDTPHEMLPIGELSLGLSLE